MKIKIIESNRGEIAEALAIANGRATAHTAGASDVFALAAHAESELSRVAKIRRAGATAKLVSGGKVANSYKYERVVTEADIVRGGKDWYLTAAKTRSAWPSTPSRRSVQLNYAQTLDVLAQFAGRDVGLTLTQPEVFNVANTNKSNQTK